MASEPLMSYECLRFAEVTSGAKTSFETRSRDVGLFRFCPRAVWIVMIFAACHGWMATDVVYCPPRTLRLTGWGTHSQKLARFTIPQIQWRDYCLVVLHKIVNVTWREIVRIAVNTRHLLKWHMMRVNLLTFYNALFWNRDLPYENTLHLPCRHQLFNNLRA
jgi:hypothetical protein